LNPKGSICGDAFDGTTSQNYASTPARRIEQNNQEMIDR
jgi:hypothetical protein